MSKDPIVDRHADIDLAKVNAWNPNVPILANSTEAIKTAPYDPPINMAMAAYNMLHVTDPKLDLRAPLPTLPAASEEAESDFALAIERFELVDQRQVLDGHDSWGPMAFAGGRLILRDLKHMICLNVASP